METAEIAALAKQAAQGDPNAFEQLYLHTRDAAYFTALSITKNEDDALDMVQEAYLTAWQKLSTLEKPESFVSWFRQITANGARMFLRKRKPLLFTEDESVFDWEPEPDGEYIPDKRLDTGETNLLILDIVYDLPDDQRVCVMLHYYENMPVADMAASLGVSQNTVKSRLYYARDKIKTGVQNLEKTQGLRLYAAAPVPLAIWVLKQMGAGGASNLPPLILGGASSAGAAGTAGTAAATKIVAAAVAGVIAVGGIAAGILLLHKKPDQIQSAAATAAAEPSGWDISMPALPLLVTDTSVPAGESSVGAEASTLANTSAGQTDAVAAQTLPQPFDHWIYFDAGEGASPPAPIHLSFDSGSYDQGYFRPDKPFSFQLPDGKSMTPPSELMYIVNLYLDGGISAEPTTQRVYKEFSHWENLGQSAQNLVPNKNYPTNRFDVATSISAQNTYSPRNITLYAHWKIPNARFPSLIPVHPDGYEFLGWAMRADQVGHWGGGTLLVPYIGYEYILNANGSQLYRKEIMGSNSASSLDFTAIWKPVLTLSVSKTTLAVGERVEVFTTFDCGNQSYRLNSMGVSSPGEYSIHLVSKDSPLVYNSGLSASYRGDGSGQYIAANAPGTYELKATVNWKPGVELLTSGDWLFTSAGRVKPPVVYAVNTLTITVV